MGSSPNETFLKHPCTVTPVLPFPKQMAAHRARTRTARSLPPQRIARHHRADLRADGAAKRTRGRSFPQRPWGKEYHAHCFHTIH
eukprot:gene2863-biopygen15660